MSIRSFFTGRLGGDPEIRTLPGDGDRQPIAVANFSVAVYDWRDKSTTWARCEAWGSQAQSIADKFRKGDLIYIEARTRTDTWEDKASGETRSREKYRVTDFGFPPQNKMAGNGQADGEAPSTEDGAAAAAPPAGKGKRPRATAAASAEGDKPEIPFK